MLISTIISISISFLYFRGYQRVSFHPPCPSLRALLQTSLEFATACFGPKVALFWPYSSLVMLGLLLISIGLLIVVWWRNPQERFRVQGILAFLVAMVSLSLAIGYGRAGFGPGSGFCSRYVTLAVPLLGCVYFIWGLYGGRVLGNLTQMTLFALMYALLIPNMMSQLDEAKSFRRTAKAMEQDLCAGLPISVFIERHHGRFPYFQPIPKETAQRDLMLLQRAAAGKFRYLRLDSPP